MSHTSETMIQAPGTESYGLSGDVRTMAECTINSRKWQATKSLPNLPNVNLGYICGPWSTKIPYFDIWADFLPNVTYDHASPRAPDIHDVLRAQNAPFRSKTVAQNPIQGPIRLLGRLI